MIRWLTCRMTIDQAPTPPTGSEGRAWWSGTKRFLVRRWYVVVATAATVVLVAAGGVVISARAEASRLVDRADARHTDGNCAAATEALDHLSSLHRLVAGDIVDSSEQGRRACDVLLDAAAHGEGAFDLEGLTEYIRHPGARWEHAGVVRAGMLLGLSDGGANDREGDKASDQEGAMKQLVETLSAYPDESTPVRELMSTYVERFMTAEYSEPAEDYEPADEVPPAPEVCATRGEYLSLHDGGWTEPELAEPIATTSDRGDDLLAACAQEKEADGKLTSARWLYDEYLASYADEPDAKKVRRARDQLVQTIRHKRFRDRAVANANHPADGSTLSACGDGRCQVRVRSGTLVRIGGPGGPIQLLVTVSGGSANIQLGGVVVYSYATTGGTLSVGDGYMGWGSGPRGELVLNDKVGIGVDGVRGGRATLSVWRAG